ncbi:MAG: hypothetical protein CMF13_03165 [Idiomarina sp.]|nr:hypothetical protein [Idiomarina sp.]|tara:strand:- start:1178 stop:1894 length:717 start_codon:yes stop_codon:yes gene_type:complete
MYNALRILLCDKKERAILIVVALLFFLLCLIELQLDVIECLKGTVVERFLAHKSVSAVSSGILSSILAAYVFYLLIDFIPRSRREQSTSVVLNALIASVLDAYKERRVFGHELAISQVDRSLLNKEWLERETSRVKARQVNFDQLKFAMQTAHTRLEDFRSSLPLAVSLSPEKAMQWLVITDKVRLFAESYGIQPFVPKDKIHLIDSDSDDNPLKQYKEGLSLRMLEFVEQAIDWCET